MRHRPRPPATPPRQTGPKPSLPMLHLPHYRVKQRDLEAFLARVYRMERFDFLVASGATPGLCPEFRVEPVLPSTWNAREEADQVRRGHRPRNVALILNILCLDGYIPAGKYTIDTHPEPPPEQVYRTMLATTEDPGHPACVAFKREHRRNRAFMQMATRMEEVVIEQRRQQCGQ